MESMDGFRCGGWVGLGDWMCNTGNGYVEMRGECELQGGGGEDVEDSNFAGYVV